MLEIGVDRGVTFLTLVTFLARTQQSFFALGVDVNVQEQVSIMLEHIDLDKRSGQVAALLESNSLDALPKMLAQGMKFNVILLDGDHNYHTVSQEMPLVAELLAPDGILIVDDYNGKWSDRDLFYSEREGYENVTCATPRIATEKHGVKPAVDDWLSANPGWIASSPMEGEPVLLMRKK